MPEVREVDHFATLPDPGPGQGPTFSRKDSSPSNFDGLRGVGDLGGLDLLVLGLDEEVRFDPFGSEPGQRPLDSSLTRVFAHFCLFSLLMVAPFPEQKVPLF